MEGWKLVPVEPTTEMKVAGDNAGFWCGDKYRAMLDAAPIAPAAEAQASDIKALVNRFLAWPLPASVASDGCVTDADYPFPRSGTNLLNATEAEAMLMHVLTGTEPTLLQFRWLAPDGEASDWQDTTPREIAHLKKYPPSRGGQYYFRELYAVPSPKAPAVEAGALDPDAVTRLKGLCRMLGLENAIPEELYGAAEGQFVIFGQMRSRIEKLTTPAASEQPVMGSEIRNALVSMECTAQWLENGCDPKEAAKEIRMVMKSLQSAHPCDRSEGK